MGKRDSVDNVNAVVLARSCLVEFVWIRDVSLSHDTVIVIEILGVLLILLDFRDFLNEDTTLYEHSTVFSHRTS